MVELDFEWMQLAAEALLLTMKNPTSMKPCALGHSKKRVWEI